MKLSFGSWSKTKQKKTILFVCVQNAGRSQMAEGFFRKYAEKFAQDVRMVEQDLKNLKSIIEEGN